MIHFTPIVYLHLGPISIATHGLLMAIGIGVAFVLMRQRAKQSNLSVDVLDATVFAGVLGGIFGARLLYVVLNPQLYSNIFNIFKVWEGGLVSFGGLIGGLLGAIIYLKYKKQSIWVWLDLGMPYLLLGWSIGRLGDLISWSEIGTPTTLPWGFVVNGDVPRHPAQLYETITLLLLFWLLTYLRPRLKFTGGLFAIGLMFYGLNRFLIEFIRDYPNSEYLFSYRNFAQITTILIMLVGLGWYFKLKHLKQSADKMA